MITVPLQCILDLKFCVTHSGTLPLIFKGPEQGFDANNCQIVSQGKPCWGTCVCRRGVVEMASKAWYFHSPFKFVASVRGQRRPWSNCADWSGHRLQMFGRHVLTQSSSTLKAPSKIYRRHKNKTKLKMSVAVVIGPLIHFVPIRHSNTINLKSPILF